jgi:hypothetical protein
VGETAKPKRTTDFERTDLRAALERVVVGVGDDAHGELVHLGHFGAERLRHGDPVTEQPTGGRDRDRSRAGAQQAAPTVASKVSAVVGCSHPEFSLGWKYGH